MHTPYDGSSKLFQIGLKPLDPEAWIDVDEKLGSYLAEKERLAAAQPDAVFAAEPGTEDSQAEVLAMFVEHLPRRFPETYRREGAAIEIVTAGRRVALDDPAMPPLRIAASLVQDDLVLMRKAENGWRLVAASLSFPSSWNLAEKFGRPMHEVHGPVPGFGAGTRNAALIERMFDNLRPETGMVRWNWSLYGDDELFHPVSHEPDARRFGDGDQPGPIFLRLERQTLRRLPQTRDILFTIRIYIDPLSALEQHSDGSTLATAIAAQLDALDGEQLAYKGLVAERERLTARLRAIESYDRTE
jgi:dimethylamine monooxygenase subunit A